MGILSRVLGYFLALSLIFLAYGPVEAKSKLNSKITKVRTVDFDETDYEMTEVIDAQYKKQDLAQHNVKAEQQRKIFYDINQGSEPNLREPAKKRKSTANPNFESSYKEFQKYYSEKEIDELVD